MIPEHQRNRFLKECLNGGHSTQEARLTDITQNESLHLRLQLVLRPRLLSKRVRQPGPRGVCGKWTCKITTVTGMEQSSKMPTAVTVAGSFKEEPKGLPWCLCACGEEEGQGKYWEGEGKRDAEKQKTPQKMSWKKSQLNHILNNSPQDRGSCLWLDLKWKLHGHDPFSFSWLIQVNAQVQSKRQDRMLPLSLALLLSKRKVRGAATTISKFQMPLLLSSQLSRQFTPQWH